MIDPAAALFSTADPPDAFDQLFPDEAACVAQWLAWRWPRLPHGFRCPRCAKRRKRGEQTKGWYLAGRGLIQCSLCQAQVSLIEDTWLRHSHLPLRHWFRAAYLSCTRREAINARALAAELGVTYETAWRMAHGLRQSVGRVLRTLPLDGMLYFGSSRHFWNDGRAFPYPFVVGVVAAGHKPSTLRMEIGQNWPQLLDAVMATNGRSHHRPRGGNLEIPDYVEREDVHLHDGNPPVVEAALAAALAWLPKKGVRSHQPYLDEFCWIQSRGSDDLESIHRLLLGAVLPPLKAPRPFSNFGR